MEDYKGIYYNESKEQKFFEGGAHFRYKDLFKILKSLGGLIPENNYFYSNIQKKMDINKNKFNLNSFSSHKQKDKKQKPKTRNINNFIYVNNPNTKKTCNSNKVHKKGQLSIKNFNRNKSNNILINDGNLQEEKKRNNYIIDELSNLHPNTQRYHANNNLVKTFLSKNIKYSNNKNIMQKINSNNDINAKKKYVNIINYFKFIHHKNKSEAFTKKNNIDVNDLQIKKNIVIRKKNATFSEKNNINNNKMSMDINTNNINIVNNNENQKYLNVRKKNCFMVYGKTKNNLSKDQMNNEDFYFGQHGIKKSRNITNKDIYIYRKTFENQMSPDFKTNGTNNDEISNNVFSSGNTLNNKTMNINSIDNNNNIAIVNNLNSKNNNNKTLNFNKNGNIIVLKKYIKKKINQYYDFNKKNLIKKNGKKYISRNINNLNSNYNEQNIKFKTTSEINSNANKIKDGK